MKIVKVSLLIIGLLLTLMLPGCGETAGEDKELKSINISTSVGHTINEKGERKVIITVTNRNYQIFSGFIKITSMVDGDESLLAFDGIYQDRLGPGGTVKTSTWMRVDDRIPNIETEIVDGIFYQLIK